MLYTKIQPQSVLGPREEDFQEFLPFMDMAAILFSCAEPNKTIGNTLLDRRPMRNLVKIAQAVLEKKTFKNNTILYMYIAQWQGQITLKGQNFDYN